MTAEKDKIEELAKEMRSAIRLKAGLRLDWNKASDSMKDWYRMLAKSALDTK